MITMQPTLLQELKTIEVSSPAFSHQGIIPVMYTCESKNINPPLTLKKLPLNTKSLVIIVDDPDAVAGTWTALACMEHSDYYKNKRK